MKTNEHLNHYRLVFRAVRRVLNYVDPESLDPGRPGGAPKDEYDMEAEPISAFVVNNWDVLAKDSRRLAKEIDRVWKKCFDRKCPASDAIASEIVREILKSKQ